MKTTRMTLGRFCIVLLAALLASCAQSGRKPLEPISFSRTLPDLPGGAIVVGFEESVPGKPLAETVWDNVSGPFWDAAESKQIGFTLDYKPQFFFVPPEMVPLYAKAGINLNDTRLIVPFGNILSSTVASAARKNFSQVNLCYDEECVRSSNAPTALRIKVEQFFVWESPVNHMNLYVKGRSLCSRNGTAPKEHRFERHLMYQEDRRPRQPLQHGARREGRGSAHHARKVCGRDEPHIQSLCRGTDGRDPFPGAVEQVGVRSGYRVQCSRLPPRR